VIIINIYSGCQKLTNEELETHASFDKTDNYWTVDTSIPADWRKLNKLGWEAIHINECSDGSIQSVIFKAPKNAVSFRAGGKFHCDKLDSTVNISDEQRELASKRMKELRAKQLGL
jgi:hypothetical protein